MHILDEGHARALHARYAPGPAAFDSVYTHCLIVAEVAGQLIDRNPALAVDHDLVAAGALLHDIGVYRLYDSDGHLDGSSYIRHGVLGQELLAEAGLPDVICRFAAHHTGVGLTKEDVVRQALPIPPGDYLAETPEEELVMYADKFHSKSVPPSFLSAAAYRARVSRFGQDKAAAFDVMLARYGEPELAPLAAAHGQPIA